MIPQHVINLIASAFPGEAIGAFEATFGGYSNVTVTFTAGQRPLVAKVAESTLKRADVRREALVLDLFRTSGLPISSLVTVLEDSAATVEVLAHSAGTNGLQFFNADAHELPALFAAVGRVLAQVHTHRPTADATLDLLPRYQQTQRELALLPVSPDVAAALAASLDDVVWQTTGLRLVHGDPGLHNVLWHNGALTLLDWEWAGWGNPLLDVAWIYWITRLRNLPPELWQSFQSAYGAWPSVGGEPTPHALRALVLGHIAFILVRARHLPTWDEWLRRATWTVGLEFPHL